MHRDIKPSNILVRDDVIVDGHLTPGSVKLGDFDFAVRIRRDRQNQPRPLFKSLGTPGFMAPEVWICEEEGAPGYGPLADMFAVGVVAYELLSGSTPFPQVRSAKAGALCGRHD